MSLTFSLYLKQNSNPSEKSRLPLEDIYLEGENGSTVILVHGLTGTPNEMKFLAGYLNKQGYSVICPRLAFHGGPLPILKKAKWQNFYESVRQAMMRVQGSAKHGHIFVGGLCMGALLTLLLAEEFQNKISGVSCLAPTFFYDGWNMPWYRHLLPLAYLTPLKHFFYFKEDFPYGVKNEAIRARIHKYYRDARLDNIEGVAELGYPYLPVVLLYEHHLLAKNLIKRFPLIQVPVQLIQAKDDDTTSIKNSELVLHRIGSAVKEMVLLEDSYHVITVDQERHVVAKKMADFFSRFRTTKTKMSLAGDFKHEPSRSEFR